MRFNRPQKIDAITYEMLHEIEAAAREADADDRLRAVTDAGRLFSAGTDLKQLSAQPPAAGRAESLALAYSPPLPLDRHLRVDVERQPEIQAEADAVKVDDRVLTRIGVELLA